MSYSAPLFFHYTLNHIVSISATLKSHNPITLNISKICVYLFIDVHYHIVYERPPRPGLGNHTGLHRD